MIQLISVPLLAPLLRRKRSEDIPPLIPTCFLTAQSGFNRTGRSCPEPAADWPSAEHRAWALRKFSAPCSQGHGKSGRVRAAALQDSQEPRPLFASPASFRWSLNLFFKGSRLGEHSEGKPEVGRGKLGTRRRRFGAGRMGGLSNFLSWVSWGGGLRRRGKGRCQLASPRGLKGVRLILSWGALEAPVSSWCFGGFFELVMRPGVCCREPAEPALCGQPGSEPAGRWIAWETGRQKPPWRRAEFGPGQRPAPVLAWMPGAEACPCGDSRGHEPLEHQGERSAPLPGAL